MLAQKFQAASTGQVDRTIFIFDAITHHGCVNTRSENKNDTTIKGKVSLESIDESQARRIAEEVLRGRMMGKLYDKLQLSNQAFVGEWMKSCRYVDSARATGSKDKTYLKQESNY